jgi:hypothetical protein
VGAGNINIGDQKKQAALIKAGVTGALASVNRDLTKTHSETTVKVETVNVFVSSQSLVTLKDIASKIADYLTVAIQEGKIPTVAEVNKKRILEMLNDLGIDPASITACLGGGSPVAAPQSGSLFNLLFTPAYASSFKECYIRFNGLPALVKDGVLVPDTVIQAAAEKEAWKAWENAVGLIRTMANMDTESSLYEQYAHQLTLQLGYFHLCASDQQITAFYSVPAVMAFKSDPWNSRYFNAALDYQVGAERFMAKNDFLTVQRSEDLDAIRQKHPDLYEAFSNVDDKALQGILTANYYHQSNIAVSPLDAVMYLNLSLIHI